MKTDIKYSKVVCIKNSEFIGFSGCTFIKNHIYKISSDKYYIIIYDDNDKQLMFHINSYFNNKTKTKYFTDLSEYRLQKLLKLNQTR